MMLFATFAFSIQSNLIQNDIEFFLYSLQKEFFILILVISVLNYLNRILQLVSRIFLTYSK